MSKSLCKSKKKSRKQAKIARLHLDEMTHVCKKCGRVAQSKGLLCKPLKIVLAS